MKCHYEVLGVPRNASDDELKRAYRKLALQWHPDKNLDTPEEAKEQFQLVQQAWEILSDPHERAWYDNHREAILKGGIGDDYKDDAIDLFQYFSTTCFKGYGDDEKGFYAVYRRVFEKLAAEDAEFAKEGDSDEEVPGFGDSQSSYEEVVHNFYAYWQSYSTKRSFAWLDPYDIRDTPNRKVLRIVEKENKKVRDKAKRERNEQVRNLVAFVRKRDKRVQAHAAKLAERAKENFKKAEERKKQQLLERQKLLKDYKVSEWSKFSNIEAELKNIEANLAAEFGEQLSSDRDSESDNEIDDNTLYCVACNKIFKTHKAFTNHENSKKHKDNVVSMQAAMIKDDKQYQDSSEESDQSSESVSAVSSSCKIATNGTKLATDPQIPDFLLHPTPKNLTSYEDEVVSEDEFLSDDESESENPLKSRKKTVDLQGVTLAVDPQIDDAIYIPPKPSQTEIDDENLTSEDELLSDQEDDVVAPDKQKKKKKRKKNVRNPLFEEVTDEEEKSVDENAWLSKKQRKKQQHKKVMLNKTSGISQQTPKEVEETSDGKCENGENNEEPEADKANEYADKMGKKLNEDVKSGKSKEETIKTRKTRKQVEKEKNKNKKDVQPINVQNLAHCCATCNNEFSSKNKLFEHLKKTGHSVYIPDSVRSKKYQERVSKGKGNSDRRNN